MTYADMEADRRERDYREQAESYARMAADPFAIFVFGSNRQGIHGGGAAKTAHTLYGARWGQGEGLSFRSYAIPTKETPGKSLSLPDIRLHVEAFKRYAKERPDLHFIVTRVGCGLAGWTDFDIAPMFAQSPPNCILPEGW